MSTVNPHRSATYYLTTANNPITFGAATNIDVSSVGAVWGFYRHRLERHQPRQHRGWRNY